MTDTNNKTGISPSTLGRERKRYFEMSQIDGVTKKQIEAQMKIDAKRYAKKLNKPVSFEDYQTDIEDVPVKQAGKRENDKAERDTLIVETQDFASVPNLAQMVHNGDITLTDAEKCKAFDALGLHTQTLSNHMVNAFDKIGGMTMLHAPDGKLAVHIAGWEDGSKNLRFQYAPRKLPITKRSGYRDDSMIAPVFDVNEVKQELEPEQEAEV